MRARLLMHTGVHNASLQTPRKAENKQVVFGFAGEHFFELSGVAAAVSCLGREVQVEQKVTNDKGQMEPHSQLLASL